MRDSRIQFGILGCGMIANVHADAIKRIPEAILTGVAGTDMAMTEQFARKYGIQAYNNYDQMLKDDKIDVICICTPSGFHAQHAIQAMETGKHVVLEKPMALDTKNADEIISVCEKTGKHLTVISQLRFSEDIIRVKKLLADGVFGKVSLCSLYMKYYRSPEYYSSSEWKGTKRFDGGGALMNQGIHGFDLLEYIGGSIKDVKGKIGTLCHQIEVEDTAVAMLEFQNGALGVIEASTCAYPGFERRIEIHGDRGYVVLKENNIEKMMIDGEVIETRSLDVAGTAREPAAVQSDMHLLQIKNLIGAIKGNEKLLVDCFEGRNAVRVIEEIYRCDNG